MSVIEFIQGLPSHNVQNFSQFNTEFGVRMSQKRPSVYLPTEDYPSEQHIVMDKRSVLLRYLTQQWDKKLLPRKREHNADIAVNCGNGNSSGISSLSGSHNSCKKRSRLDAE